MSKGSGKLEQEVQGIPGTEYDAETIRRKGWYAAIRNSLFLILALSGLLIMIPISPCYRDWCERHREKIGSPFAQGEEVIRHVRAYMVKYGRYPRSLDELVPEFVDRLPPPDWGTNTWQYYSDDNPHYFELYVKRTRNGITGHLYTTAGKAWWYDNSLDRSPPPDAPGAPGPPDVPGNE